MNISDLYQEVYSGKPVLVNGKEYANFNQSLAKKYGNFNEKYGKFNHPGPAFYSGQ